MRDYEELKDTNDIQEKNDKIFFQMISQENNEQLLSQVPYVSVDGTDLVLILRWKYEENKALIVKHGMTELLAITEAEMIRIAEENLAKEKWKFRPIVKMMSELMDCVDIENQEPDIPMYILTNEESFIGARLLHAPEILDYIREQVGRDYFILPSSTHELLIIPDDAEVAAEDLAVMVREVNETEVEPQDRLSNHVYHYSAERGLVMAL